MNTKHTPGPWIFEVPATVNIPIYNDKAGVEPVRLSLYKTPGENVANARLIAAAPDMFETLETCLVMAELQEKRHGYSVENAKIAENIREAIAKAKG